MQDMKKIVLAAILVVSVAVAPGALAQDGAQPLAGIFAPIGDWLASFWELLAPSSPAANSAASAGEPSEFMGYTIPGG